MKTQKLEKILDHVNMISTHCYFNSKPYFLANTFFRSDGKIDDSCLALLAADYLVIKKDIGFRIAHEIVGRLSSYLEKNNKMFYQLTLEEYNQFSKNKKQSFDEDIFNVMRIPVSVKLSNGEIKWKDILDNRVKYTRRTRLLIE